MSCRFSSGVENLLDARIALLNDSFSAAIAELSYQNRYNGVFPIKVNQQAAVIEEIGRFGARYGHRPGGRKQAGTAALPGQPRRKTAC